MDEHASALKAPAWALVLVLAIGVVTLTVGLVMRAPHAVRFHTPYQAVLLSNGAVFYGHLEGYGTKTPVLTNVFYIVTQENPETKQPSSVLVKRGKELHGPDRMYLDPKHIIFVEPVGRDSRVAKLIEEAK